MSMNESELEIGLWSEYGKACANLEMAQNKHMEIKKKIAATLNKAPTVVPTVEPDKE